MLCSLRILGAAAVLGACMLAPVRGADAPDVKLSAAEQKILELTNKARAEKKLPPLALNDRLTEAARAHSANMGRQGKMEHVLDGRTPGQRIKATGYRYSVAGENIAWTDGNPPASVFDDWMKSRRHRENILNPEYTEIGIGVVRTPQGEFYYTQDFARPKKAP
jgi:uncharacterized protein YkwD